MGSLYIGTSAVKTWLLIYERVSAHLPGYSSDHEPAEGTNERGKEKKQRLLAYVREHPEGLRPAAPQWFVGKLKNASFLSAACVKFGDNKMSGA